MIMNTTELTIGRKIYFIDNVAHDVHPAVIDKIEQLTIDENTTETILYITDMKNGDALTIMPDMAYIHEGDAKTKFYADCHETMKAYLAEINTVEDLVRFAYTHDISINQTDNIPPIARAVYQRKAKELLNIEL